jgi:hypothetical protein
MVNGGWLMVDSRGRREKAEGRRQKTEDKGQKAKVRRQKTEDRRQKTEERRQKAEDSHMGVGWTGFENLGADVPLTPPSHGVLFTDRLDDR